MADHIVSGADEKVIRIFDPPFSFIQNLNSLSGASLRYSSELTNEEVASKLKEK